MSDPMSSARRHAAVASVVDTFVTLLDRVPTPAELARWADALARGEPAAAVRAAVEGSEEFRDFHQRAPLRAAVEATGLFDAEYYLLAYPDIAAAGIDPLNHFVLHGRGEGRSPNAWLNVRWYRATHGLADGEDALSHYLEQGEAAGLAPCADFDPAWYRRVNGLAEGNSPLRHFLRFRHQPGVAPCARLWAVRAWLGERTCPAGHDAFSLYLAETPTGEFPRSPDLDLLRGSGLFDENYYALHSNDVLDAEIDPLVHFCQFGWREGRDPNFYFKLRWYVETNPEVATLGVNPLVHYLLVGEPAGRRPVVFFEPVWYRQAYDIPPAQSALAHFLANRRGQKVSPHPLFDPEYYMARCGTVLHPRRDPFSHFLIAGMQNDVAPSDRFDPAAWRKRTTGRQSRHFRNLLSPERDNPLINYLLATYR